MRPAFALGLPDDTGSDGLAGPRARRIMDGLMVTLRGASALVGAVLAVVGLAPPARPGWTLACAALFVAWGSSWSRARRRPPVESLQAYDRLCTHLDVELGIGPSAPLRALHRAVRCEDRTLEAGPGAALRSLR